MAVSADFLMPDVMARHRGRAKRDLIAQAAVVAKQMEESAQRCREIIMALKSKEINEWEMVEGIHHEVFGRIHDLPLTELVAKLVAFQLMDLEARRSMIKTAEAVGVMAS